MNARVRSSIYSICPKLMKTCWDQIDSSVVGSRLARGVFWSIVGSVISRGLILCAMIIVARILGKTEYGELGMIQSTIGVFGTFAGFGLGLTATKHVAEFRKNNPDRTGRIITLSGLFAIVTSGFAALCLLIFAPWLATNTINAPHLTEVLRISAIILFLNALNGSQTGTLSGFEAFKTIAYVNLLVGIVSFPIIVAGAYWWGLYGAVWALAINLVFNWLFNHIALRKEMQRNNISFMPRSCTRELPLLWKFALPATLSGAMVGPANWVCRAFLTEQPKGYDEIGFLTAALIFQAGLLFVARMLNGPLLSMMSNVGVGKSDRLSTLNMLSSWCVGVVIGLPLLCFPELAQLMLGSDYASSNFKITFALIIFCTIIMMFTQGIGRVLVADSLLWWGFFSNAFWALVLIISSLVLCSWGARGLATALVMAYILNTAFLVPLYNKRNLVPKRTLVSFEALMIWCVMFILLIFVIYDVSFTTRCFSYLSSLLITLFAFKKLFSNAFS